MRNDLVKLIIEWMKKNSNVLFLTADIGGAIYKELYQLFPKRVYNVGIAEQNMIGMAAGLTNMGFRVICYSKACFISLRVADQIKNALCYPSNNVILIASDAGYDEAIAGHPHVSLEDIGIIQSIPGIDIYLPSTAWGLKRCFQQIMESGRPSYLRINKGKIESQNIIFPEVAEAVYYLKVTEKKQTLCITYGYSAIGALDIADGYPNVSVLAVDTLQFDEDVIIDELKKYGKVIVFEEQFESSGIYDYFCRLFIRRRVNNVILDRIGPRFSYLNHCFDREEAWKQEREIYKGGF